MNKKDAFYIVLFSILFSFNLPIGNNFKEVITPPFSLEDKSLNVSARLLKPEETSSILKQDIAAHGYTPIEITIVNQGSHLYEISRASTSLPCATAKEIAWKKTQGSIPRSAALKIVGFIFWPFAFVSGVESIATFKNHQQRVSILHAKGFKDDAETVAPYSLVKRVLYIPEEKFEETFSVSLEDLTNKDLVVIPVKVQKS